MAKTSSIGMRKGLSLARTGVGMYSSTAFMRSKIALNSGAAGSLEVDSSALSAEPRMIGVLSPSNLYLVSSSRTSSSTSSSSSSSSTMSTLLRKTTICGTST
jgi:hypothetical protein